MTQTSSRRPLQLKPDLDRTIERFEAWWLGEVLDRPPVELHVTPTGPYKGPISSHATLRDRWLDVSFQVDQQIAELSRREFVGDALPTLLPNVGPEISSTLLGVELEFGESTSWSVPTIHDAEQWREIAHRPADFANVYWQAIEQMTQLALEKCDGRYLVGIADLHGSYDLLAGLREPQMLCMDLVDCPDLVDAAAQRASEVFVEALQRNYAMIAESGQGSTTWLSTYHQGLAYVPSCDFWCMLSEAHARELVLPRIVQEIAPMQRSVFHLDGPQALRHLDVLLEIESLHAVQWVYGAGSGPAADWIDVYRRIRAAGKSAQVLAETADDALTVLDALGPDGLFFSIGQPFDSVASANDLLAEMVRRSRR
jgi:hypothetical protein